MVVGGEFGNHALVFGVPQDAVQIGEVLEDVEAVVVEVSGRPTAQLRPLENPEMCEGRKTLVFVPRPSVRKRYRYRH